jgi:hypothetical protein
MKTARPVSWAQQELGQADLVDKRLVKRMIKIAEDFYHQPQASIPQASGSAGQAKAAYRFFDNDVVAVEELLAPHQQKTSERCADQQTVLAINDTSFPEFTSHPATQGLGKLSQKFSLGMAIHPTLAATTDGTPLGLVDLQIWTRPKEPSTAAEAHPYHTLMARESEKWLNSYEATLKLQARHPAVRFVHVSDRESDFFDLFAVAQVAREHCGPTEKRPEFLIRVTHNRALLPAEGQSRNAEPLHLREALAQQPLAGLHSIIVPRRNKKPARTAVLEIRFAEVLVAPSKMKTRPRPYRHAVKLWAVWAYEKNPPAGVEAIDWMLLTTIPVTTLEEALEKIQWYTQRWLIELFFKVLKSGCRFEDRQLETAERLERCLVIDLIVAWRILYMTQVGRELPDLPCTVLFEDDEWQALYCFVNQTTVLPKEVPTLQSAVRMVAKLGGFLGRKRDGEPGIQTLWLGLQRLHDITAAWRLFRQPRPQIKKNCG